MELRSVLENPKQFYLSEGFYIDGYEPDVKRYTIIPAKQSGAAIDQTIKAKSLGWKAVLVNSKMYLVSDPTRDEITLHGETGYENAERIFDRVARLYRNEKSGLEAKVMTEDFFRDLPKDFRQKLGKIWLSTSFSHKGVYAYSSGVRFAMSGKCYNGVLKLAQSENAISYPICIVIEVPENTGIVFPGFEIEP